MQQLNQQEIDELTRQNLMPEWARYRETEKLANEEIACLATRLEQLTYDEFSQLITHLLAKAKGLPFLRAIFREYLIQNYPASEETQEQIRSMVFQCENCRGCAFWHSKCTNGKPVVRNGKCLSRG